MTSRILCLVAGCFVLGMTVAVGEDTVRADRALWKDLRRALMGPFGEEYFEMNLKGASVPGGIEKNGVRVREFRAKVVSWTPEREPLFIELRVDGEEADVRLHLDEPFEGTLRRDMTCSFEGIVIAFSKVPFLLDFDVVQSKIRCR